MITVDGVAPVTGYGSPDYSSFLDPNLDSTYIYFDSVNGTDSSVWPYGTRGFPVSSWDNIVAISAARSNKNVKILSGVLTLTDDAEDFYFTGNGYLDPAATFTDNCIELAGFSLSYCTFDKVNIHNALGGVLDTCGPFNECAHIYATTITGCELFRNFGEIDATTITGCRDFNSGYSINTTTLSSCFSFRNCYAVVATTITSCLGFSQCVYVGGAAAAFTSCSYFDTCGYIIAATMTSCTNIAHIGSMTVTTMTTCSQVFDVSNMAVSNLVKCTSISNCYFTIAPAMNCSGLASSSSYTFFQQTVTVNNLDVAQTLNFYGEFTLDIAASCTLGTINVYGNIRVVNSSGGTTVNNYTNTELATNQYHSLVFYSAIQEQVQLTNVAADRALPDITVAGLPAGSTVVSAVAIFKCRMIANTNGASNELNGAQYIQGRDDTPGAWANAIQFVTDMFEVAATTREPGMEIVGQANVSATVDGNDTYNFQWAQAVADLADILIKDVQIGLIVWYSL
jgi:hypothetical protein